MEGGGGGGMNDGEFRDWARAQFSGLEGRMRAVEARPIAGGDVEVSREIEGEIDEIVAALERARAAGRIAGLAIAFVTTSGVPVTGYATMTDETVTLAGACSFVGLEVLERRRHQSEKEAAA